MSDQRKGGIAWTDETWNPIRGCTRVSAGCENCYAEKMAARFCGPGMPYEGTINPETKRWNGKIRLVPEKMTEPLRWTRPRRIFVNSMSDLFHDGVPFEFIADVFAVMSCTTRHTYQILTKRPERMLKFFEWLNEEPDCFGGSERIDPTKVWPQWTPSKGKRGGYDNCGPAWPLENVWLGVTAENQQTADERIPLLLQAPAAVRWVSMEPLLGAVDLRFTNGLVHGCDAADYLLDWVVVGGESGTHARPTHPDWVRSLRDQCAVDGVPFLFKQWGEWAPRDDWQFFGKAEIAIKLDGSMIDDDITPEDVGGHRFELIGKKAAGRLLDGALHDEYQDIKP